MSKKPILFVSDSISASSGLARITRDLAVLVHQNLGDRFRVATVGYGGAGSARFPFPQYHLHTIDNWITPELPAIADDFAQGDEPIICFVWDASRLYWLGTPEKCHDSRLRYWVENAPKKLWIYGAIDAEGPNGKISHSIAQTYKGFDRVLDYTEWSTRITGNAEHLPHGIDTSVFYPRDRRAARSSFVQHGFHGLKQDSLLVGIVATNQARKNWQLGMEACRILLDRGHDVRVWAHTDVMTRYWDLDELVIDYGLAGRVAATVNRFTDDELAELYSACDVTLGVGPEGMGYPIMESLACGVPCVTGNYAAQSEYVPKKYLADPIAFYYEGAFCSKRPVFNASEWADKVESAALESSQVARESILPESLDWNNLWPRWSEWFMEV